MATNGDFMCPYDASETLMADIAAQVGSSHVNEGKAHREPPRLERRTANNDFVCPYDASDTLIADIAAHLEMPREHEEEKEEVRDRPREDENIENEPLERIHNVIRSSIEVGDCQNREFLSAIEQLVTLYKDADPETFAAQQVIRAITGNTVDQALATILHDQLTEGLRYYRTSKNFGGNLNNVIKSILGFFDVFTLKSLEISRHAADRTCLVEAIKLILTKFKVQHFQNTLDENIQKFLYLGLKLSCQLLMYEDDTVLLCIKDKGLVDILRLYISSPDPQFQLPALTATAYLSDVGNNDRFFVNPLTMKTLTESLCNNNSQIATETIAQALEKLMRFEDNVEMLMELDFISTLRTMLETDDVSVMLIGLRLLYCLSSDDSIAPLVNDRLKYVLSSRCLSFPQPAVKTATIRLFDLLSEKSRNVRNNIFAPGEDDLLEERNRRTRDIINRGRHIMLSYSHRDKPKAEEIYEFLRNHHFEVWLDRENPKNNLDDMMASAVENASMFICCISKAYKRSDNTKKELLHAASLKKTIIPVRLEECSLDGWLGINIAGAYVHDFREITDGALFRLLQDISGIRGDSVDGEMLTLRLEN